MTTILRLGTRGSPLALWQAHHVAGLLRAAVAGLGVELITIETAGDRQRDQPLVEIGGEGVFTKQIQVALQASRIDVAVHSLKDLPTIAVEGLELAAVPPRGTTGDAFVSLQHRSFEALPEGAAVATSSLRRRAQLLHRRPDLRLVDIRGNVETRLAKLAEQGLDGTVLAQAGLERLGLARTITEILDPQWMLPAVGQGALALECRVDDEISRSALAKLNHRPTFLAVLAERAMLRALGGGCQVPIGAAAHISGETLTLRGAVLSPDGTRRITAQMHGELTEAESLGERLAKQLLVGGAARILQGEPEGQTIAPEVEGTGQEPEKKMNKLPLSQVAVHLRPQDNVAVAARPLQMGLEIQCSGETITLTGRVGLGHKFALGDIQKGEAIYKYGQIIGFASRDIPAGAHVHVHNVAADLFERDYAFCRDVPPPAPRPPARYFQGYDRGDGRFGTRNYIAVISTVNCSASTSKYISEKVRARDMLREFPNVDGVVAITHKAGCAMQYDGPDHHQLDRTLAGFAKHANVAAYILVGLGCETGQALHLVENQGLLQLTAAATAPTVLSIQECGGIGKTVDAGVEALARLLPRVNDVRRVPLTLDKLVLGTNCGGSDGNSGVTANPALGIASDLLIAHGGASILGETPEIFGAEHLLTRRAISLAVGEKLIERIKWWQWYTGIFGAEINNNPSPGNKDGGLTTIYEKSLGAIAKGGSTALVDVVVDAEPVRAKGLVVMDTPGYDPVSMTGIVAGGANILVFTTGRGSVFGCKPAPSIKVATNSPMYHHMVDDMDINAGEILDGLSVEEVGRQIFEEIIAVASGKKTKSELSGVGEEEFAPWSIGPTL